MRVAERIKNADPKKPVFELQWGRNMRVAESKLFQVGKAIPKGFNGAAT